MSVRNPHKEAYWRSIIRLQQQSPLNVREFCQKENISEHSFYTWRRVLKQRDAEEQPTIKTQQPDRPVASDGASCDASGGEPLFAPVSVMGGNVSQGMQVLEVLLPNGAALRVPPGFDSGTLANVLSALQAAFLARPDAS